MMSPFVDDSFDGYHSIVWDYGNLAESTPTYDLHIWLLLKEVKSIYFGYT
jgi:hypothetical protein